MTTMIYWGDVLESDYFFGTRYRKEGRSVFFENPFMPATLVIHRWSSLRPYQANRRPVDLPLLKRGQRYQLSKQMTVFEGNPLYVKVLFYNRYNDLISQVFIKEDKGDFSYPDEAYWYEIELVNTACQRFRFDYLILKPLEEQVPTILRFPKPSEALTVIFQEDLQDQLPDRVLADLGNVLVIAPETVTGDFISDQRLPVIEALIADYLTHYREGRLIAYGTYGSLAVVYLSFFLEKTKAYHLDIDRDMLKNTPFTFGFYLDDVLSRRYVGQNLVNYQTDHYSPQALSPKGNDMAIRQLFYLKDFLAEIKTND